jgi:hypothetical protein
MLYKTIMLGLLEERPRLYRQLAASKTLGQTLHRLATALIHCHQRWIRELERLQAVSDQVQCRSRALELAIRELTENLPPESAPSDEENQPLDLHAAMMFIYRHMPAE